jgi:hypothetical protein
VFDNLLYEYRVVEKKPANFDGSCQPLGASKKSHLTWLIRYIFALTAPNIVLAEKYGC